LASVLVVGSIGDSYDNALAETVIGLFKTEVIRRLEPIGNISPAEAEARYYADLENLAVAAQKLKPTSLQQTRRGSLRIIA
jgi:hypothetical protein